MFFECAILSCVGLSTVDLRDCGVPALDGEFFVGDIDLARSESTMGQLDAPIAHPRYSLLNMSY